MKVITHEDRAIRETKRRRKLIESGRASPAILDFWRRQDEANERLKADPNANPHNMNLEAFDVDKMLARPYRMEKMFGGDED